MMLRHGRYAVPCEPTEVIFRSYLHVPVMESSCHFHLLQLAANSQFEALKRAEVIWSTKK